MVSQRCKMVVKKELKKLGLHYILVDIGEVDIMEQLSSVQRGQIKAALLKSGLELMDDKRGVIIEKIKEVIAEMMKCYDNSDGIKFSEYLGKKLKYDYTYMSNLFSELQGMTLEKYLISCKIERVKELIIYNKLSLYDISLTMNYSSIAHMSNQFKRLTGLTLSHFRSLKDVKQNLRDAK